MEPDRAPWRPGPITGTCDGAGASHGLITRLDALASRPGHQLTYLVGWDLAAREREAIRLAPQEAWQIAIDHRVEVRGRRARRRLRGPVLRACAVLGRGGARHQADRAGTPATSTPPSPRCAGLATPLPTTSPACHPWAIITSTPRHGERSRWRRLTREPQGWQHSHSRSGCYRRSTRRSSAVVRVMAGHPQG